MVEHPAPKTDSPVVDRVSESDIINHAIVQVPGRKNHAMRRRAFLTSLPMGRAALLTVSCSKQSEVSAPPQKNPIGMIVRLNPTFDQLVSKDTQIEKLAGGFTSTEDPPWRPPSALWFSHVVGNVVCQWTPDGHVTEILRPGGYDGNNLPPSGFIGPNGMTADKDGAVPFRQRRIARIEKDRKVPTLVDRFEGKKLNSPNDLVFRSDGSLLFTDPPYGLPTRDHAAKELKFNARLASGKLQVINTDVTRSNGTALSPGEKTLYVANSDEKRKVWMRYDLAAHGTVSNAKAFADVTEEKEGGLPGGMTVDTLGNVYATAPGGVSVFSPDGKHLGKIKPPETRALGDGGKTIYITAQAGHRIKLAVTGQKTVYR
jgi:gluconolactonase